MTLPSQRFNWGKDSFFECYCQLKDEGFVSDSLLKQLKPDLLALATYPSRGSSSPPIPEEVEFSDGKYKLNTSFRETATILLLELNMDPLAAADLCHFASADAFRRGTDLLDSARALFFHRIDLILQIVGFLVTSGQVKGLVSSEIDATSLLTPIISSFETVHAQLLAQNEIINKQRASSDINSLAFAGAINFTKSEYLHQHESLGKLLFSLIQNYPQQFATVEVFNKIINTTNKIPDNDILTIHFLPSLLQIIFSSLGAAVEQLYKSMADKLQNDYLKICESDELNMEKSTLRPLEVFLILVFLTKFIQWCKEDEKMTEKYSFTDDILKYIEWCISYGAFEKFLCIAADTTKEDSKKDDLYDFRLLLERSFPRLQPLLLSYQKNSSSITSNLQSSNNNTGLNDANLPSTFKDNFSISSTFNDDLIAPLLHSFVQMFITCAAVVLTLLRDSEEDFLLSLRKENDSEVEDNQLDLDELASRADLERFYFAASYIYHDRADIVMDLWETGDIYGFIQWASSNNTLPLITATFSILLGSLANETTGLKIWDILINMSTMKKNDFLKLLADSIVESLQYYIDALNSNFNEDSNNQRPDFLRLEENKAKTPLLVELTEDSLVFISGFVQLIGGITNSIDQHTHKELKSRIWSRFKPVIESFLILDNKAIKIAESFRVLDDNRATLVHLMLYFLSSFVDENLDTRHEIWEILDKWLYHGFENKRGLSGRPAQVFLTSITRLTQIEMFITLIGKLFKPLDSNLAFEPYRLLYPVNLGALYRAEGTGIWPYVEFLLLEVFSKSQSLEDNEKREKIQNDILVITNTALKNVDWVFLCQTVQESIRSDINLDSLIDGKDVTFPKFVKVHHSLAFLSYLFESRVYGTLFKAFEKISNVDFENNKGLHAPLETIKLILDLQTLFNEKLIRMLKNDDFDIPRGAGQGTSMSFVLLQQQTQGPLIYYKPGLQSIDFYEALLFNLPVVATFGMLVGSSDPTVALAACSLLKCISNLQYFVGNSAQPTTLGGDRLLTTFKEIDDSNRIIFSFIQQIEGNSDVSSNLEIKKKILDFLLENLGANTPTVAHFLLGYEFQGDYLKLSRPGNTLLKTLVYILSQSLDLISYVDFSNSNVTVVDGPPAAISSKILEVLVKLCQSSITSEVTLKFLRNYEIQDINLFTRLLKLPRIDRFTEWSSVKFSKELSSEFLRLEGPKTLIAFVNQRDQLLKYFALELHNIPSPLVQRQLYVDALLKNSDFLDGTPNVLQFLDVGILNFDQLELKLSKYSSKYNLEVILEEMGKEYDLTILEKIFKFLCTSQHEASKDRQKLIAETVMDEGIKFTEVMLKCAIYRDFRAVKFANIHSWVQLIQVMLTDTDIDDRKRSDFVLEAFQIVLPKINDYLARDVQFAEELISLCVLLFDVYEKTSNLESALANLIPLFLTCISGVVGLQAAPDLRLDLYVLLCRYLQKLIIKTELRKQLVGYLKSAGNKFIDTICNDAVYAEGPPRITALVLLEQLVHLSSTQKHNFVFELMLKNNLLMLLARLLKRTDEIVSLSSADQAGKSGISASTILYELTAFKLTIYLLVRLASTRAGALQLVQNEIFPVILDCKFLQVDPDVGLYLHFQESKEHNTTVKLLLDVPLVFDQNETGSDGLSYYEFLVPVFQLVTLVLISMGPSYQPGVIHGKQVLEHFKSIIVGILKRDSLLENSELPSSKYGPGTSERLGLEELMKLITLLDSLVHPSN